MTVRDLVEVPYLGTRVHAGRGGFDREIRFAHACEMPKPWDWLDRGDLLLTSGMGLPAEPAAQADYVSRLAAAGMSGMSIGEASDLPTISPELVRVADRKRFPVLMTAYEVPWVAVIRAVIDANAGDDQARLAKTARLYDLARTTAASPEPPGALVLVLGQEMQCDLWVCENDRGRSLLPGAPSIPVGLRDAFLAVVAERGGRMPAVARLESVDHPAIAVPVPSSRRASLIVRPRSSRSSPDVNLLQHVATVLALEVERSSSQRAHRLRLGAELLAEMLDVPMDMTAARHRLAEHGVEGPRLGLAAWGPVQGLNADLLHELLLEAGINHVLLRREDCTLTLQSADDDLAAVAAALAIGVSVGVSDPLQRPSQAPDAVRQAVWALQAARAHGAQHVCYGAEHDPFMPRTLSEAQVAVERILGVLLAYDKDTKSELVRTLESFLSCNRSWKRAAEDLFIHKQTLVYRIKRIEELTGRHLDEMQDVAELWLALRARSVAQRRVSAGGVAWASD